MDAAHQARPWYAASAPARPPLPPLEGEARADVGIVGAYFARFSSLVFGGVLAYRKHCS